MKADVTSFFKQCTVCQQAKHELMHPTGLLQPLPIPQGAWLDWLRGCLYLREQCHTSGTDLPNAAISFH
jgi:hypothetical protein